MTRQATTTKRGRFRLKLFGEIINELRKVVWLSRREALYLTLLVVIVSLFMGLILGAFDYGFARLVNDIFIGR